MSLSRHLAPLVAATLLVAGAHQAAGPAAGRPSAFAARVEALSEAPGSFDTDNLISNERSYPEVLPLLDRAPLRGGAYVGVGPDQNFSYIARLRPSIAFIVDIRRDNLLLHLLFKALLAQAATRGDYLAALFGRAPPGDPELRSGASVARLAAYIESHPADRRAVDEIRRRTDVAILHYGIPLTADDLATIGRFHRSFIDAGLELRFRSTGRPPQAWYPTYRDLLLATTPEGTPASFLGSEESFQFVKSLQARDLVIPVVGDLAGPTAVRAIGRELARRHLRLAAFYTSNVEFYLARAGTSEAFEANLASVPRLPGAVVIRAVFGRFEGGSRSVLQSIDELVQAARR